MLTTGQEASISSEAAQFIRNIPYLPFATLLSPFLASSRQVKSLRESMAAKLLPIEDDIIATHELKVSETRIADVMVVVIEPPEVRQDCKEKIPLNFYGGGFVMGNARERAALLMCAEMKIRVYSVAYSKSPEVRYPVARDEAFEVYRHLIRQFGENNIICTGSSSGGQILVSMLLVARRQGLAMPARIYLCTPALDLSGAGDSMVSNSGRDVMPASLLTAMVKQNYMPEGMDVKDPFYSPLYADYDSSFPSTVITVGTRDLCLSGGVRMYWKLRDAGVEVELLVGEGMWHGFNWAQGLPEANKVRQAVNDFLLK